MLLRRPAVNKLYVLFQLYARNQHASKAGDTLDFYVRPHAKHLEFKGFFVAWVILFYGYYIVFTECDYFHVKF